MKFSHIKLQKNHDNLYHHDDIYLMHTIMFLRTFIIEWDKWKKNLLASAFYISYNSGCCIHMGTAFVLLTTEPGREREVYLALTQLPEVVEVHALYGEHDLLAHIETKSTKELTRILIERFRMIEGVRTTQTLIAVDY